MHPQKKFVVTGGAGFIGTNLVQALLTEGCAVTVVDDLRSGQADRVPGGAILAAFDISDTDRLAEVCVGADAVVHLAALPRVQFSIDEPQVAHAVNVDGTLSVLEAVRQSGGARLVFASSSAVYGDQDVLPLDEALLAQPKSPYALHKYIGEGYLKLWAELYGIETVSLRFFNVYGPALDPDGPYALVIGRFLKLAQQKAPLTITGTGEQTRDFVHVHDVVRAIILAATTTGVGKGEVINIGSGVQTSINEVAALISEAVTYVPPRIEPMHTCARISRAHELLGWEPQVTLAQGLGELKRSFGL